MTKLVDYTQYRKGNIVTHNRSTGRKTYIKVCPHCGRKAHHEPLYLGPQGNILENRYVHTETRLIGRTAKDYCSAPEELQAIELNYGDCVWHINQSLYDAIHAASDEMTRKYYNEARKWMDIADRVKRTGQPFIYRTL